MSMISTFGQMQSQRGINSYLQGRVDKLIAEASSGTYQDIPGELGAKTGALYQLQAQRAGQTAVQTAATAVGDRLTAMQTALTSMNTLVTSSSTTAISVSTANGFQGTQYAVAATQASGAMDQMLGLLNTTYNGQYVFSGQDSGATTMADSSASGPAAAMQSMLNDAVTANGGAPLSEATLSGLTDKMSDFFADSGGGAKYGGTFFTATDNGSPVTAPVGGGKTLSYDMKGNSQAFRDIFQGMSMLSLLGSSSGKLDDGAKQALAARATEMLSKGQTELTAATATLGTQQSRLSSIQTTQQTAATATQASINDLVSVDQYAVATQLQAYKTQLSASYEITSQIPNLSFVNYMK